MFDSAAGELAAVTGHDGGRTLGGFAGAGRLAALAHHTFDDLVTRAGAELRDRRVHVLPITGDHEIEFAGIQHDRQHLGDYADAVTTMREESLRATMQREERAVRGLLDGGLRSRGATPVRGPSFHGRSGVALAVQAAAELLTGPGTADLCLVGCFDSLLDDETLDALARTNRLKCADNPIGLMPGEAGVALLLRSGGGGRTLPTLGLLEASVIGSTGSDRDADPVAGAAQLAQVLRQCAAGADEPLLLLPDLNGEPTRAMEWGTAITMRGWPKRHDVLFPAATFGDTGCAAGAIGAALALHGWQRRHLAAKRCVVTTSASDGKSGLCLTAPPNRG